MTSGIRAGRSVSPVRANTAIVRIEQLYPFPGEPLTARLKRLVNLDDVVWAQEEPKNNGAWFFVEPWIEQSLADAGVKVRRPRYATRPAAAATAVGQMSKHQSQLKQLLEEALG